MSNSVLTENRLTGEMSMDQKLIRAIVHYQQALDRHKKDRNDSKMMHCIERLFSMPITVAQLQETGVGRTVNSLRRLDGKVSEAASTLVEKWKNMVQSDSSDENTCDESNLRTESGTIDKKSSYKSSKDTEDSNKTNEKIKISDKYTQKEKYNEGKSLKKHRENDKFSRRRSSSNSSNRSESASSEGSSSSVDSDSEGDAKSDSSSGRSEKSPIRERSKKHERAKDENRNHSRDNERRTSSKEKDRHRESKSKERHKTSHSKESDSKSRKSGESRRSRSRDRHQSKHKHENGDDPKHRKRKNSESKDYGHKENSKRKRNGSFSNEDGDNMKETPTCSSRVVDVENKNKNVEKESDRHKSKRKSERDEKKHSRHSESKSKYKETREKDRSKERSKSKNKEKSKSMDKGKITSNGICSESGTSFADALGMLEPTTSKIAVKKVKPSTQVSENISNRGENWSPTNREIKTASPEFMVPTPPHKIDIDINISSLLPSITPNYRPLNTSLVDVHGFKNRSLNEDEALNIVMSQKNLRTKVYSGNKCTENSVATLFELCTRILQDNIDALEYTGGVPYSILKPVLDKATPDQLFALEHHNPYLIEDTDELWQLHCKREFRTKRREELESWREMYMRCLDEREAKLRALTANIKQSQDKSLPVRQTKLAYVDSAVKPPRNIARKQAKYGISNKPAMTPASRLSSLATSSATGQVAVPNPGLKASSSSSGSSSAHVKPKKAPLMQKTLAFLKGGRFRR